jgi:hypothetical protein
MGVRLETLTVFLKIYKPIFLKEVDHSTLLVNYSGFYFCSFKEYRTTLGMENSHKYSF